MYKTDVFKTRQLSLAVYLAGKGAKYIGPEKITGDSYYFTFKDLDQCYKLEKEYLIFKQELIKGLDYKHD